MAAKFTRVYRIVKRDRADGSEYFQLQSNIVNVDGNTAPEWRSLYSNANIDEVRSVRKEREDRDAALTIVNETVVE